VKWAAFLLTELIKSIIDEHVDSGKCHYMSTTAHKRCSEQKVFMSIRFYHPAFKAICSVFLLALLICLLFLQPAIAEETPAVEAKTFPGFNEVVPQATALAARMAEAESQVHKAESRKSVYATLDDLAEDLEKLEESYSDWEEVTNWQINRLLRAQSIYADLREQQIKPLDIIYTQLNTLENLRSTWEKEKTYWQEWQGYLRKIDVKAPTEAFKRSLSSIDTLLKRIIRVGGELVKAQQKYSPGQEIIASRLSTIGKALDSLRMDTFRRNAFSMFELDYYRQFDRELLVDFKSDLLTPLDMSANFLKQHGWAIGLQLFSIVVIALLLIYRNKQSKPLTKELSFLFRRPLAGATFVSFTFIGNFTSLYTNMPLGWRWLLVMIITIAVLRLANSFYVQPLAKNMVRTTAIIFIITESLRYFGLPTPLLQFYNALLCTATIPIFWRLIRSRDEEKPLRQRFLFYLIFGVAITGLVANVLGNESFTTNLIDATLSTTILIILLRMGLRLCNGGVEIFMHAAWIKDRHFIQVLGPEEGTSKLQNLLRIIILVNAGLYMTVIWMIYDSVDEAREVLMGFEYNFGEFSISIQMVVMVIVVIYLTTIISWVIQAFLDSQIMTPRKMDIGVKESLKRLTHYGLFTVGFLVAVSMAGLDLQKFTILAGALGVGIGFGLQNIVNNFVSGLILLFERPVKVGDVINIDQDWGTIKRIGLRSTIFETFDRAEIIVPNADLVSQKVTNWTFSSKIVRVNLPVGVAYGSPLEKVLEVLNRAAREHPDVFSYPEPDTIFEEFGNSSINFKLRFWVHTIDDRMKIRSEVAVIIDRLFREEGVEIPFPQQDLHLRSVDSNLQTLFGAQPQKASTDTEGSYEPT
jgi:potassium efflux system protein